jgi:hypothetical protein
MPGDAMPLETLAGMLVGSVLIPIAKKGIEAIGDEIGKRIGGSGAEQTTSILGKIRTKIRAMFTSDDDRATLASFEKFPDDMKGPFERTLAAKLAEDPTAATELHTLLDERPPEAKGMSIGTIMADTVGVVDFRGGTISGGIVAGVVVNPQPRRVGEPHQQ